MVKKAQFWEFHSFYERCINFNIQVGSKDGFGPWLEEAEARINNKDIKPSTYDQAMEYEQAACAFLKEVVQGNKLMKRIKDAAEGNLRNILMMIT